VPSRPMPAARPRSRNDPARLRPGLRLARREEQGGFRRAAGFPAARECRRQGMGLPAAMHSRTFSGDVQRPIPRPAATAQAIAQACRPRSRSASVWTNTTGRSATPDGLSESMARRSPVAVLAVAGVGCEVAVGYYRFPEKEENAPPWPVPPHGRAPRPPPCWLAPFSSAAPAAGPEALAAAARRWRSGNASRVCTGAGNSPPTPTAPRPAAAGRGRSGSRSRTGPSKCTTPGIVAIGRKLGLLGTVSADGSVAMRQADGRPDRGRADRRRPPDGRDRAGRPGPPSGAGRRQASLRLPLRGDPPARCLSPGREAAAGAAPPVERFPQPRLQVDARRPERRRRLPFGRRAPVPVQEFPAPCPGRTGTHGR
jgi:hypothetical protein